MKHLALRIDFPQRALLSSPGSPERYEAPIPSTVHDALYRAGAIADPFYRTEEMHLQWIEERDWSYEFSVDLPEEALKESQAEMVCEGLDTYARVEVNGLEIGKADNMFHEWRFDAKRALKAGENRVRISFSSPRSVDIPKAVAAGFSYPSTNEQSRVAGLGDLHIAPFARKAPYHYGWDWGPRFLTCGIWRPGYFLFWSDIRIAEQFTRTIAFGPRGLDPAGAPESAHLRIGCVLDLRRAGRYRVTHRVVSSSGKLQSVCGDFDLPVGRCERFLDLRVAEPELWWCNGMGEPNLYSLDTEVEAIGEGGAELRDRAGIRFGLRQIALVREPDEFGTSFRFELNGRRVFAAGANHIPDHSFLPLVTKETHERIVGAAQAAGMNMLRVWGGGVYEDEAFYDCCDRMGILVWQDFMFACAMYPGDRAFLGNVEREIDSAIRRLRHHVCIALWCGNNEMDSAWRWGQEGKGWSWKEGLPAEARLALNETYDTLFNRMIPGLVAVLDPGRDYWPSSPQADWGVHADYDSRQGDVHYWGVWHQGHPFERYQEVLPRFMSEYGFQSFPDAASTRRFALLPEDGGLESEVMKAHQRNQSGNAIIRDYMERYLKVPSKFEDFLLASQILQAEAIRGAIVAHRLAKPRTAGSLYWQLNDCWPAASWSSIDFYGRWKALHYMARRVYSPVMAEVKWTEDGGLRLFATNDRGVALSAEAELELFSLDGSMASRRHIELELDPDKVWSRELFSEQGIKAAFVSLKASDGSSFKGSSFSERTARIGLGEPGLSFGIVESRRSPIQSGQAGGLRELWTHRLKVETKACARFVHLELPPEDPAAFDLSLSDDWFDLAPGASHEVEATTAVSAAELGKKLRLRSVYDICGLGN
jgi:Beta-galactosidase/beta-glucuronidase